MGSASRDKEVGRSYSGRARRYIQGQFSHLRLCWLCRKSRKSLLTSISRKSFAASENSHREPIIIAAYPHQRRSQLLLLTRPPVSWCAALSCIYSESKVEEFSVAVCLSTRISRSERGLFAFTKINLTRKRA